MPRVPPPINLQRESHREKSTQRYREMPSPVFEDVDETFMTEELSDESFVEPSARQMSKATPYRPRDNNIFGSPDEEIDPNDERARFTTTYT